MLVIASMCYAFYTIVLVITFHATIATLSPIGGQVNAKR